MKTFLQKELNPREFTVLDLRFGLTAANRQPGATKPRTFREIGKIMEVTGETARLNYHSAVGKISSKLLKLGITDSNQFVMMI